MTSKQLIGWVMLAPVIAVLPVAYVWMIAREIADLGWRFTIAGMVVVVATLAYTAVAVRLVGK